MFTVPSLQIQSGLATHPLLDPSSMRPRGMAVLFSKLDSWQTTLSPLLFLGLGFSR